MHTLILVGLMGFSFLTCEHADARSAVVLAPDNQPATACSGPIQREEQRALAEARRRYSPNVTLLAATDVTGYGAIAVARCGTTALTRTRLN